MTSTDYRPFGSGHNIGDIAQFNINKHPLFGYMVIDSGAGIIWCTDMVLPTPALKSRGGFSPFVESPPNAPC